MPPEIDRQRAPRHGSSRYEDSTSQTRTCHARVSSELERRHLPQRLTHSHEVEYGQLHRPVQPARHRHLPIQGLRRRRLDMLQRSSDQLLTRAAPDASRGGEQHRSATGWSSRSGSRWERSYLSCVRDPRRNITVRRVPLRSADASDARVGGTAADRLALVRTLSLSAWANSGRPLPAYTRAEISVRKAALGANRDRD